MPRLLEWEQLQEDVRIVLEEIDGRSKISRGSGAVKGNGDVTSNNYMVECKYRSTDSFSINRDTFRKIQEEAALLGKIPALATRNKKKETLITLSLKDFIKAVNVLTAEGRRDYGNSPSPSELY